MSTFIVQLTLKQAFYGVHFVTATPRVPPVWHYAVVDIVQEFEKVEHTVHCQYILESCY